MDHGSQYLSDHFTNQIKFWGIQPSYAFVAEPQTNGVAERFNRTLKEQIIHGRIYRNIAELRDAVRDFVELYNAQWIVEKNGLSLPFIPSCLPTTSHPSGTDIILSQWILKSTTGAVIAMLIPPARASEPMQGHARASSVHVATERN